MYGAQRETERDKAPKPSNCTSGREGRVPLRKTKGENKGFSPLAKWLSAARTEMEEPSKVKEGKGKGRGKATLDPIVRSIKERFEVTGEAKASQMKSNWISGQDPVLGLDPGKS